MVLLNIVNAPFVIAQADYWVIGLAFLLAGCYLGIGGLIISFLRDWRGVSIGFSVAAIGVWLLGPVYIFVENGFQHTIEVMFEWPALLLMHPPLLLAIAALINQHSRSRKPKKSGTT